jgi:hypothetical protein
MEVQNRKCFLYFFFPFRMVLVSPNLWLLCAYTHTFDYFIFRSFEDFEILHGDMLGLTDTMSFLKSLSGLVENDTRTPEKQPRERAAASVLFDWEVYNSVSNIHSGFFWRLQTGVSSLYNDMKMHIAAIAVPDKTLFLLSINSVSMFEKEYYCIKFIILNIKWLVLL